VTEVVRSQLRRSGVAIYQASAHFLDRHTGEVQDDGEGIRVKGEKILVAYGTRPAHSPEIPFDNHPIVDTDHVLRMNSTEFRSGGIKPRSGSYLE
jgi:NAD(P) transhydrogenase